MAQLWHTGPVDIYVQFVASTSSTSIQFGPILFLGHSEREPHIDIRPVWRDVYCDLMGGAPIDRLYANETALVSVTLNRFNNAVFMQMMARPACPGSPWAAASLRQAGLNYRTGAVGRVGTLAVTEGASFILYLRFPFAAKTAYGASGANWTGGAAMVPGYRFFAATLDPDHQVVGANSEKKHRLTWTCLPVTYPFPTIPAVGDIAIYDHDMSGLPAMD